MVAAKIWSEKQLKKPQKKYLTAFINMNRKEPEVWMTGFDDNILDFVLLIWLSKYSVRRPNRIKTAYLWELDAAFNQHGMNYHFHKGYDSRKSRFAKRVNRTNN